MVWSEQVGVSLVLPSDRQPGDGRNYIVIGEDVPSEVSSAFTAALVFRNGHFDSTQPDGMFPNGFVYWVVGISTLGALEIVSYYYTVSAPSGGAFTYYRRTLFSAAPPIGVDSPPVLSLGYDPNYGSFGEGNSNVVIAAPSVSGAPQYPTDTAWTAYTPSLSTMGNGATQPTLGNGTIRGWYKKIGRTVHVEIQLNFGSTTSAGNGGFAFGLPPGIAATASGREQYLISKAFTSDGKVWVGHGFITSNVNGTTFVAPYFPVSATSCNLANAQSANVGSNATGQGIPLVAGNYPFVGGSNIYVQGTYEAVN